MTRYNSVEIWPKHFLTSIRCPVCGENSFTKLYPLKYPRIVKCDECKLIYTNPRIKKEYLSKIYDESYFKNKNSEVLGYENYIFDRNKIEKTFNRRLKSLKKNVHSTPGRLLDIGCAAGFFLNVAKKQGWTVSGVEISQYAADYARDRFHHNVILGNFDDIDNLKKFDCVTLWDVIEHVPDPKFTLRKISTILNNSGLLIISTPDVGSIPAKVTRHRWVGFKLSDEHLTYFSISTLRKLLEDTGFELIDHRTTGKYVSLEMLSDRIGLYLPFLGKAMKFLISFFKLKMTIYVSSMDIMMVTARKK